MEGAEAPDPSGLTTDPLPSWETGHHGQTAGRTSVAAAAAGHTRSEEGDRRVVVVATFLADCQCLLTPTSGVDRGAQGHEQMGSWVRAQGAWES